MPVARLSDVCAKTHNAAFARTLAPFQNKQRRPVGVTEATGVGPRSLASRAAQDALSRERELAAHSTPWGPCPRGPYYPQGLARRVLQRHSRARFQTQKNQQRVEQYLPVYPEGHGALIHAAVPAHTQDPPSPVEMNSAARSGSHSKQTKTKEPRDTHLFIQKGTVLSSMPPWERKGMPPSWLRS